MKNKMKTAVSIALTLCLAMTAVLVSTTDVQAAKYTKKITKTVTLKRGKQCVLMMDVKDQESNMKIKINVLGKAKSLNLQAVMPTNSGTFADITGKKKSITMKPQMTVEQGRHSIYVSNYGNAAVKIKITVTTKTANIKYVSCKTQKAEG